MTDRPIIEHIARPPLPWRPQSSIAECGKLVAELHTVISRDEAKAKIKSQGKARAAFTTCMTCWDNVDRWPSWQENPVKALARECAASSYSHRFRDAELRDELMAITQLIQNHAAELQELLLALKDTTSLAEVRRQRGRRVLPMR